MSNETTIAKRDTQELAPAENLLDVIARAVADPRMDVDKMERLLALHQTIVAENRKVAYQAAMARLQEKLPQITKDARIIVKGTERSRYAKLEKIDDVIRPLLAEEGFSFSFDSQSADGKLFTITARLSHREGHAESKSIVLPMDASDYRSNVQSIGSTVSYAKRQLVKMHLNIIESDEDDDGNGGNGTITDDQVKDLETLIQDTGANLAKFLEYMAVGALNEIRKAQYPKAITALETKRRGRR